MANIMLSASNAVTLTSPPIQQQQQQASSPTLVNSVIPPSTTSTTTSQSQQNHLYLNVHNQTSPNSLGSCSPNQIIQTSNSPNIIPTYNPSFKDTRWLTLEVCREHQRNKCNRTENECKFAHPPQHVEIINGKVIACYDSLKSKCTRKEPPCKYLHPPQHLKDQLLQNGKNNLVLKQVALAMMQQQQHQAHHPHQQTILTTANGSTYASYGNSNHIYGTIPTGIPNGTLVRTAYPQVQISTTPNGQATYVPLVANGYHTTGLQIPQTAIYDPSLLQHVTASTQVAQTNNLVPPHQRTDRLTQYSQQLNPTAFITNICPEYRNGKCQKTPSECIYAHPPSHCPLDGETLVTVCVDFIKGKCARETCKYFHPPEHLVSQLKKQKSANSAAAAKAAALAANATLAINTNTLLSSNYSPYNSIPTYQHHLNPYQHHVQSTNNTTTNAQQYHLLSPNSGIHFANASQLHTLNNGTNHHTHHSTAAAYLNSQSAQLAAIAASNTNLQNSDDVSSYAIDSNNAMFQQPFQILGPIYQTHHQQMTNASNVNNSNNNTNTTTNTNTANTNASIQSNNSTTNNKTDDNTVNQTNDLNKATASSSATANATANVVVDVVVPNKKRQHDAIEDFIPMQPNIYPTQMAVKRTALADSKTGLPVFQPTYQITQQQFANLQAVHQANGLNTGYSAQTPFTLQYTYPFPFHYLNGAYISSNMNNSVYYLDKHGEIMETLQVCRDFNTSICTRPQCKYVHLTDEYKNLKITNGYVTICKDALFDCCAHTQIQCKYYHTMKNLLNMQIYQYQMKKHQ